MRQAGTRLAAPGPCRCAPHGDRPGGCAWPFRDLPAYPGWIGNALIAARPKH